MGWWVRKGGKYASDRVPWEAVSSPKVFSRGLTSVWWWKILKTLPNNLILFKKAVLYIFLIHPFSLNLLLLLLLLFGRLPGPPSSPAATCRAGTGMFAIGPSLLPSPPQTASSPHLLSLPVPRILPKDRTKTLHDCNASLESNYSQVLEITRIQNIQRFNKNYSF